MKDPFRACAIVSHWPASVRRPFGASLRILSVLAFGTALWAPPGFGQSACGAPSYTPSGDTAVYVWRECPSNVWQVRTTSDSGWVRFSGSIQSAGTIASPNGVSLEPSDQLDVVGTNQLTFRLGVSAGFEDGFSASVAQAAGTCFRLSEPAAGAVVLGATQTPVGREFDLATFGPCSAAAALSVDDRTARENSGPVEFTVARSGASSGDVSVDYGTAAGTAAEGDDYVGHSGTLVIPGGETSATVAVDLVDDDLPEAAEQFRLELSNAVGAALADGVAVATIQDDDATVACGAPAIDFTADRHVFLWKGCSDGRWRLRASAGGGSWLRYGGSVEAASAFGNVVPFQLEASDELEQVAPGRIEFVLGVSDRFADGFDFSTTTDSGSCFALTLPAGSAVLVGPQRLPRQGPFDLGSLEACGAGDEPYNIVVVFTDDQRFDTLERMPNVNGRLLPRGVEFQNAYVPTPLCCPARASTFSGGFLAQNTGVLENTAPNGGQALFNDDANLGTRLQGAGYRTMFVGKWLNDYPAFSPYVPPGWDSFVSRAVYAEIADWSRFRYAVGSSGQSSSVGTEVGTAGQYHAYFERDRIVEFIDDVPAGQPFFVFWSTTAPHAPGIPDAMDENAFPNFVYRGRGYGETDLSDKPFWVRNYTPDTSFVGDAAVRAQLRTMLAVDRGLGSILDVITARGELERTVFIVTSDNGYLWGEHGLWGKNKAYEESIRVPLLVVVPGIAPRSESRLASAVLDLGPTLYDVAGVAAPSDGRSLLPLLENPATPWRNELFFEKYAHQRYANALWAGLRTGRWKYVAYWNGDEELYDLSADPFELENRAGDPAVAAVQADLSARVDAQRGLAIVPDYGAPAGRVGVSYQFDFEPWGGRSPFSWSVNSGALPPGLTLSAGSGTVTGVPTTPGEYTFVVRVRDSALATQAGRLRTFVSSPVTIRIQP